MMRKLFILGTALFWLCILITWIAGRGGEVAVEAPVAASEKRFSLVELAQHSAGEDCWMAIEGKVYDLSAYLPKHPSKPSIIVPWCGREASQAYRTKTKGRKHSAEADGLLGAYLIGVLGETSSAPARQ
ncbi:Cytochrome b5 [Candidatus Propionivibrio aalborgensis]|uniref:Cytochrome b5 n=1 Tax=Candidatus Propionivibrio aalborgensis TaxID=1860101 RepID=A0A1A8XKM1_9RHOO|nr:cytochrome b5 domain-containing protein [Propionivibrio sp.]MBP9219536.1 cytochrome b5 domain-containing protein [Sterolibacterium sp.]SBT04488.1 Cytochrome b5 [Candidatus Propionivibrio aalborgensis]